MEGASKVLRMVLLGMWSHYAHTKFSSTCTTTQSGNGNWAITKSTHCNCGCGGIVRFGLGVLFSDRFYEHRMWF